MSVRYCKANSDEAVANIYVGTIPEDGASVWSVEEGRAIRATRVRAQVALHDIGEFGPIFAEPGEHGYPSSFDDVRALCRWVIRSGGKVVIPTVK